MKVLISFEQDVTHRHTQAHSCSHQFQKLPRWKSVWWQFFRGKRRVWEELKSFFSPQKPDRYPRDFPFLSFRQTSGKLAPRGHQLSKPAGPVPCPVTTGGVGPKGVIRGCWETRGKFMRLTCILGWFFFLVFEGERKVRGKLMLESFLGRRFSSFSFPFLPSLSLSLSSLFRFVENWSN